jgi:hypothetical protein
MLHEPERRLSPGRSPEAQTVIIRAFPWMGRFDNRKTLRFPTFFRVTFTCRGPLPYIFILEYPIREL